MQAKKPHVAIFGAGVGGLTVAHELSKTGKFDISVYEKLSAIGGMARSSRDDLGCATEYCWRIYFGFYENLLSMLTEIGLHDNNVSKHLVPAHHVFVNQSLSYKGLARLGAVLCDFGSSCDQRAREYDDVSWYQLMKQSSGGEQPWDITAQWLGLDRFNASAYSVLKVGFEQEALGGKQNYIMDGPTSECWFDPWQRLLRTRNVQFYFNHSLVSLDQNDFTIRGATIQSSTETFHITPDIYVLAVPVQSLACLFPQWKDIQRLAFFSFQIQMSVQVFWKRPVKLGNANEVSLLGSPWGIIINIREACWSNNNQFCTRLSGVYGSWSIALCQTNVPGLFGKPARFCTPAEIYRDIWAQMTTNKDFMQRIREANSADLCSTWVAHWAPLWPTFDYQNQSLISHEPKFSNNVGTLALRPSVQTQYPNVFISTAYVKEATDIFCMEGATRAGKLVAMKIQNNVVSPSIGVARPAILAPFRALDKVAYEMRLPNLFWLYVLVLIGCLVLLLKSFQKKKKT